MPSNTPPPPLKKKERGRNFMFKKLDAPSGELEASPELGSPSYGYQLRWTEV
jgi:hypothetical protein